MNARSVALADVELATRRLAPFITTTPLVHSAWLSSSTKADVRLKLEAMQPTGSFKVRGAMNALLALRERHPSVTAVVTASAGNHGLALSWAAAQLGITVRVHLPASAPRAKCDALARFGSVMVPAPTYDEAELAGREDARASGLEYISPYNDPDIIAGAATIALEIFLARPEINALIAPVGGGGLLAGLAVVAKSLATPCLAIGAEVEASPVFTTSLKAGAITRVDVGASLADGLIGNLESGSMTFDLVRRLVDRVVLVSESSLETAMRDLVTHERIIAEPSSATGIAALQRNARDFERQHVGVVVTGRNVDWPVMRRVLAAQVD